VPDLRKAFGLALPPALLSVGLTLLRLTGELAGWSETWFSRATGGTLPHGWSWLVGITWLPVVFGPYFAYRLWRQGDRPASPARALLVGLLGLAIGEFGWRALAWLLPLRFPPVLLLIWAGMLAAALLQWPAWPGLFRVLLVYGLLSRAAVALVMLFAMLGDWGTHYDYVGMPEPFQMPLVPRFLWLALFPQLVFWTGFTIVLGSVCGALAALVLARRQEPTALET